MITFEVLERVKYNDGSVAYLYVVHASREDAELIENMKVDLVFRNRSDRENLHQPTPA